MSCTEDPRHALARTRGAVTGTAARRAISTHAPASYLMQENAINQQCMRAECKHASCCGRHGANSSGLSTPRTLCDAIRIQGGERGEAKRGGNKKVKKVRENSEITLSLSTPCLSRTLPSPPTFPGIPFLNPLPPPHLTAPAGGNGGYVLGAARFARDNRGARGGHPCVAPAANRSPSRPLAARTEGAAGVWLDTQCGHGARDL